MTEAHVTKVTPPVTAPVSPPASRRPGSGLAGAGRAPGRGARHRWAALAVLGCRVVIRRKVRSAG